MEDFRARAKELQEKATKLAGGGWFGASQYEKEEAAELFAKAANLYRASKECSSQNEFDIVDEISVDCFVKSAELFESVKSIYDAAQKYVEASRSDELGSQKSTKYNHLTIRIRSSCQIRDQSIRRSRQF
jgi:hypothetical protein